MGSPFQNIKCVEQAGVGEIILNRPKIHNAFNDAMIGEIWQALNDWRDQASIRVILFKGEGKSFCAGADLNWMKGMANYSPEENRQDAKKLFEMLQAIETFPKPVLAQVHGAALGGGSGLVAAVDMAFATTETKFAFSEVRLGLIPAVISPFVLQKIGAAKAREFFLTAERFDAQQALAIGLINGVGSGEEVEAMIQKKLKHLKSAGPEALTECKKLIRDVSVAPRQDWADLTSERIAGRRASAEGQEGMGAFLEKRPPKWILGDA